MPHKQRLNQILQVKEKLFRLIIAFSLFSSIAPTTALFAQSSSANLSTADSLQAVGSQDAAAGCDDIRSLAVNDTLQQSMARRSTGAEWIKFNVQRNARYQLAVDNAAGLQLALYDHCNPNAPAVELHHGQLEFTATRDGDFYLLIKHDGVSSASVSGYQVSLTPAAPHRPSFAPLADVPEEVVRRASDFLEEMRGSDLTPEWKDARINPDARILYRPDMQEPAYYEFTVEKPSATGGYEPAGFIQLAAGDHDYPVTQWDATGLSPTEELAEIAPLGEVTLTQFYKVDALAYAAEYENLTPLGLTTVATDVFNLGDLPGRIAGLDAIPEEPAELVTEGIDSNNNVTHEGPDALPLTEQENWDSWAALKDGYQKEYGPLLKSLKENASNAWELEKNLNQNGESLIKGDVRTVNGLPSQTLALINVTGPGATAQYLQQEQLSDNGTPTGVKLTVLDEPADKETRLTFDVALQYTSGATETVKYAIVNSAALKINQVFLPVISGGGESGMVNAADAQATHAWGPWHYWWAYGDAGSIRYGQIPSHTRVNTSGCASGCGGTAWAMLFAWVDRRAAVSAFPWGPHWGIYRVNGGLGGNAVAPLGQDGGVENMTWEIRNDISTFCIFGSGATWPWNMIGAADYVRPRATHAWRMQTKYDPTGLCWFGACDRNRDLAKDAIINKHQPAIVGVGWLKHYPLAYGYAERSKRSCFLFVCWTDYSRWFYVNNGWYGNNNGWTSATVWFAGTYYNN